MSQHWYMKLPDHISEPVASGELRRQAADGRLAPDTLVSLDRQRWVRASRVKGLDFPASGQDHASSMEAASAVQEEGGDSAPAREPADSGEGGAAGSLGAAQDFVGKAEEAGRPEKVKAKVGEFVASARGLTAKARDYARSEETRARAEHVLGKVKETSSRAKEHASNTAHRAREAAVATIPYWRKLAREIREIGLATARFTTRLLQYGYALCQTPVLLRRARVAQLALGRRMYEGGQGDEAMRDRIATLKDRIRSIEAAKGPTKILELEKKGLMIRLAGQVLNERVAPSDAEDEYRKATSACDSLENLREQIRLIRFSLAPSETLRWWRVGIGYLPMVLILAWYFLPNTALTESLDNEAVVSSLETPGSESRRETNSSASAGYNAASRHETNGLASAGYNAASRHETNGLARSGYTQGACLICRSGRTANDMRDHSDLCGFGFCSRCATGIAAIRQVAQARNRGLETDPSTFDLGRQFGQELGMYVDRNDDEARRSLVLMGLTSFRTKEWHVLTGCGEP